MLMLKAGNLVVALSLAAAGLAVAVPAAQAGVIHAAGPAVSMAAASSLCAGGGGISDN
jgi:hypothetical protein